MMFACKLLAISLLLNLHIFFSICDGRLYGRVATCCLNVDVKDLSYKVQPISA